MASGKRRGLGRGLNALLGDEAAAAGTSAEASRPTRLGIDDLVPNRYQPRTRFDERKLADLADSIRSQGVVQPIVVTPEKGEPGRFTIIAGERRWRAARLAGLDAVPVVVREVDDDRQLLEMALVENVQRSDLDPIEEAEAYQLLADRFSLSQEAIAKRVGKGRPTISNALRLLRLPPTIQDALRDGRLTAGQARPLLSVSDARRQGALAERAIEEGLTARELERLASEPSPKKAKKKAGNAAEPDVHTRAAVDNLTRQLQTRVEIVRRGKKGHLRIHFHSEEELIRLYELLVQGSP